MAKPYEKLTKTELIALCARLHKRVVRAENKLAKLEAGIAELRTDASCAVEMIEHEQACADFGVVHITQPLPRNKMPWEINE